MPFFTPSILFLALVMASAVATESTTWNKSDKTEISAGAVGSGHNFDNNKAYNDFMLQIIRANEKEEHAMASKFDPEVKNPRLETDRFGRQFILCNIILDYNYLKLEHRRCFQTQSLTTPVCRLSISLTPENTNGTLLEAGCGEVNNESECSKECNLMRTKQVGGNSETVPLSCCCTGSYCNGDLKAILNKINTGTSSSERNLMEKLKKEISEN